MSCFFEDFVDNWGIKENGESTEKLQRRFSVQSVPKKEQIFKTRIPFCLNFVKSINTAEESTVYRILYGMDSDAEHIKKALNLREDGGQPMETKDAAVLIVLRGKGPDYEVLLCVRSLNLRKHPGEVCFPGGMWEEIDRSLQDTAVREAEEEVGILPHHIQILGNLPRFRARFGVLVQPTVALLRPDVLFVPECNPTEVFKVFWCPLRLFTEDTHHDSFRVDDKYTLHSFDLPDAFCFGMTAFICVVVAICVLDRIPEFDVSEVFTIEEMKRIGTKNVVERILQVSSLPLEKQQDIFGKSKI